MTSPGWLRYALDVAEPEPSYLPVIRVITDDDGHSLRPADELRVKAPLAVETVVGDGPRRIELSLTGGALTALSGTAPIVVSAGLSPVVSISPATSSTPGSISAADQAKLDTIGEYAIVQNVGVQGALTFGVGSTSVFPIIELPAASPTDDGSMSSADFTKLAAATPNATPNAIVQRGASGEFVAGYVTVDGMSLGGEGLIVGSGIALTTSVDSYAATIAFNLRLGGRHEVTLTGAVTFAAPTNADDGVSLELFVTQGGSGSYAATWATGLGGFKFPVGVSSALIATSVGDCDYYEFKYRSRPSPHWMCAAHLKYSPP